ncbi:MAG: NAD(P)-dependent oxidoreductase [Alphaproteobacteria bacterium]|nr:NAD(P)-dependent oxidoreductase [Alphaproteobacteria bacterium]
MPREPTQAERDVAMEDPRPILVTGASGFLAAWILPRLVARGHDVVASDLGEDRTRLAQVTCGDVPALRWERCDIADAAAVSALARAVRPKRILHLAALQIPACRADPALGARVNLLGQIHVLEAARELGAPVVYTSSIAAKPRGTPAAQANLYGVYKHAGEGIARLYAADHGVGSLGLRPHVVYGVGRDQGETSVMTEAMRAAALARPYALPWSTRTCFQFAGDVAEIFVRALEARWDGAAVADLSDTVESTDDLIAAIRASVPAAEITIAGPERSSPQSQFEVAPLERIIGKVPRTELAEGVRRTIEHFRVLAARR